MKFGEKTKIVAEIKEGLEAIKNAFSETELKAGSVPYASLKEQTSAARDCLRKLTGKLKESEELLKKTEKILKIDKKLLENEHEIDDRVKEKIEELRKLKGLTGEQKRIQDLFTKALNDLTNSKKNQYGLLHILRAETDLLKQIKRREGELPKALRSSDRKNRSYFRHKAYFRHAMDVLLAETARFAEYCNMEGGVIGAESKLMDGLGKTIRYLDEHGLVYSEPVLDRNNVNMLVRGSLTLKPRDLKERGLMKKGYKGIKGVCIIMPNGEAVVRFLRTQEKHGNIVSMLLDGMKKRPKSKLEGEEYLKALPDVLFMLREAGGLRFRKENFLNKMAGFEMQLSYEHDGKNNSELQILNIDLSSTILRVKEEENRKLELISRLFMTLQAKAENGQNRKLELKFEKLSRADFNKISRKLLSSIDRRLLNSEEFKLHTKLRGEKIRVTAEHVQHVLGFDYGKSPVLFALNSKDEIVKRTG